MKPSVAIGYMIVTVVTSVSALNVLFIPHPVQAFVNANLVIARELISRGHSVTMVLRSEVHMPSSTSIPDEIAGLESLVYMSTEDKIKEFEYEKFMKIISDCDNGGRLDSWENTDFIHKWVALTFQGRCRDMLNDSNFIKNVKERKFDVAYVNTMFMYSCYELLPYNLSIPFITESINVMPWIHRVPILPSFVPMPYLMHSDKMTFLERLLNFISYVALQIYQVPQASDVSLLQKYATGIESWQDLTRKSEVLVVDRDYMTEWPQPAMPNVVFVPGITYGPVSSHLPDHIEAIIRSAEKGVVYVSFGSTVTMMPPGLINKFVKAFRKLKDQVFLCAFDKMSSQIDPIPDNMHFLQWTPQNDILGNNKTKLFINHGGHRGQIEALYHGVPMVTTGFLKEQMKNGFRMEQHGYGIALDIYTATAEELAETIQKALDDPLYEQNTRKASAILKSQPKHAKEVIADWIEHIGRFGGQHLRSSALDLPLYQFLMLDIWLFLSFIVVLLFGFLCISIRVACRFCNRDNRRRKKKLN